MRTAGYTMGLLDALCDGLHPPDLSGGNHD